MQTQVATYNHTEDKGNNLRSQSSIHDRNFWKFGRFFFHLIFVGSPFFFKILKALHKFELKKSYDENFCPHGNCFKKIDYIWKSCFQKLIFDKWQMKWYQTKKKKASRRNPKELRRSC